MSMRPDPDDQDAPSPKPDATTPPAEERRFSGAGEAVDHERQPGVPPPSSDDYEDILDKEGAESFPASDPPSGW